MKQYDVTAQKMRKMAFVVFLFSDVYYQGAKKGNEKSMPLLRANF